MAKRTGSAGLSRRGFVTKAAAAGLGVLTGPTILHGGTGKRPTVSDVPPNVLWIMTSEQRWDAIAAARRHSWLKTPTLDKLADEGTFFAETYCQSPSPVASRVSILTGRYCHQTGVYADFEYHHDGAPSRPPYFTQLLHQAGYNVANIGKEHHNRVSKAAPYTEDGRNYRQVDAFPDHSFRDMWKSSIMPFDKLLPAFAKHEESMHILRRLNTRLKPVIAGTDPRSPKHTQTAQITDLALTYLQTGMPRSKPTLLRVSFPGPHTPVLAPAPFDTMYKPGQIELPEADERAIAAMPLQTKYLYQMNGTHGMKEDDIRRMRACYFGLCSHIDDQIGRLIAAFKLRSTLHKRPWLIVFCSDHGCMLGEHGLHEKWAFYNDSVRVPLLIVSSDQRFPQGLACGELTELVDLAPTLLGAARTAVPQDLPGRNLADVAAGKAKKRKYILSERKGYGRRALLRTRQWSFEMMLGNDPRSVAVLDGPSMAHLKALPISELDASLFDLRLDPEQRTDVAQLPAQEPRCLKLRDFLAKKILGPDRVEIDWQEELPPPPKRRRTRRG